VSVNQIKMFFFP